MDGSAETRVRLAHPGDRPVIATLLVALQEHHGGAHPGLAAVEAALPTLPQGVEFALAEASDGAVLGLAAFASLYPGPGLVGGLFLKDLYVVEGARGAGVGETIMRFLAGQAVTRGLGRIDWTVGVANAAAQRFYQRLGAGPVTDRAFFRLHGEALTQLARPDGEA